MAISDALQLLLVYSHTMILPLAPNLLTRTTEFIVNYVIKPQTHLSTHSESNAQNHKNDAIPAARGVKITLSYSYPYLEPKNN
jgi:hypothetical protein